VQVRLPPDHPVVLPQEWSLAAALFGHHAVWVVLVGVLVMFLVSLAAFLLYIFNLPSDHGSGR
jgi:hypothetical protein